MYRLLSLILLFLPSIVTAQSEPEVPLAPSYVPPTETYRLRVENTQYGRIEISTDGGKHYLIIGRVRTPTLSPLADKAATHPGAVLRSSGEGIVFVIAPGYLLKMGVSRSLPLSKKSLFRGLPKTTQGILTTTLPPKQGLFGELLLPIGTPVRLQTSPHILTPFSAGYTPREEDTFVFFVTLPLPSKGEGVSLSEEQQREKLRHTASEAAEKLARNYREASPQRARAESHLLCSGKLTLRPKLPSGEPDPIAAVTYWIDGDMVAAQNTPPFSFEWDTHQTTNEEHIVEIRALNRHGNPLTRARALVVVQNANP